MFGLSVVYTSRWTHPLGKSSQDVILVHSTKVSFLLSTRHLYITSTVAGLLCGGELPRIPIFSSKLSFLVYLHLNATKELWTSWELEMIQIQQTRKKNNVWKSPKMSKSTKKYHIWIITFWHFPTSFVPLKLTYLVALFDHKLQVTKNSPKWHFCAFLRHFCSLKM